MNLDQFADFVAAVVRGVPRNIAPELARFWIENQEPLGVALNAALRTKPQQQDKEENGVSTPEQSPFVSAALAADLIPKGWEVVEDVAPTAFDVARLKPRSFLRDGDGGVIDGDEMRKRAGELKTNWSLADGRRMLAEQSRIPTGLRGYYIPLTGTVLRDSDGNLYVAFLYFYGVRWYLYFIWLDHDWNDFVRFALSE